MYNLYQTAIDSDGLRVDYGVSVSDYPYIDPGLFAVGLAIDSSTPRGYMSITGALASYLTSGERFVACGVGGGNRVEARIYISPNATIKYDIRIFDINTNQAYPILSSNINSDDTLLVTYLGPKFNQEIGQAPIIGKFNSPNGIFYVYFKVVENGVLERVESQTPPTPTSVTLNYSYTSADLVRSIRLKGIELTDAQLSFEQSQDAINALLTERINSIVSTSTSRFISI